MSKLTIDQSNLDLKTLIGVLTACRQLKALAIRHTLLSKLQMMALDTYLIQNSGLRAIQLVDVCLTQDMLRILGGTIETCNIVHVDFSQN